MQKQLLTNGNVFKRTDGRWNGVVWYMGWMSEGYAYTTVKKVHNLLTDYFQYLTQQELIPKNPMLAAPMIKKPTLWPVKGKITDPLLKR